MGSVVGYTVPSRRPPPSSPAAVVQSLINSRSLRAGIVGNSLLEFATSFIHTCVGRLGGRILVGDKKAAGGAVSAVMPAQVAALSADCNAAFVMEGNNDASNNISVAAHIGNYRATGQALINRGMMPIIIASPPRENPWVANKHTLQYWASERWLCEEMGWSYIDPWSRFVDVDGSAVSGFTIPTDGDHPGPAKMFEIGADMAALMLAGSPGNWLARANDSGGLLTNALFQTDTNADGRPDGLNVFGASGVTYALTANSYPLRGNKCVATISQSGMVEYYVEATTGFSAGDVIRVTMALGASNVSNANIRAYVRVNQDFVLAIEQANFDPTVIGATLTVPAGTTSIQIWIETKTATTGAYTVDLHMSALQMWNVTTNSY